MSKHTSIEFAISLSVDSNLTDEEMYWIADNAINLLIKRKDIIGIGYSDLEVRTVDDDGEVVTKILEYDESWG